MLQNAEFQRDIIESVFLIMTKNHYISILVCCTGNLFYSYLRYVFVLSKDTTRLKEIFCFIFFLLVISYFVYHFHRVLYQQYMCVFQTKHLHVHIHIIQSLSRTVANNYCSLQRFLSSTYQVILTNVYDSLLINGLQVRLNDMFYQMHCHK